jgi:hypothetical protein
MSRHPFKTLGHSSHFNPSPPPVRKDSYVFEQGMCAHACRIAEDLCTIDSPSLCEFSEEEPRHGYSAFLCRTANRRPGEESD